MGSASHISMPYVISMSCVISMSSDIFKGKGRLFIDSERMGWIIVREK
jgi:hypothetical protein